MERIEIKRLTLGPYGTNSYLLAYRASSEGILIDPAAEPEKILQVCDSLKISHIVMTHNHFDHFQALSAVKKALKSPVGIHPLDAPKLSPAPDFFLNEGDEIKLGPCFLKVYHTPGHTPGSVAFHTEGMLISGDTLFPGGPGKTGSPDAFREIIKSITTKLFSLPEATPIYPGHGEGTTIKKAKEEYEFFNRRPHPVDICGDVVWFSS